MSAHLRLRPSSKHEVNRFIRAHHSHHGPVGGGKVFAAALDGDRLCGVVVVENPKARKLQDGYTFELSRVCTGRTPHAASMLIAAAARSMFAIGARRCVSYVLIEEAGTSYRAAGWTLVLDATGEPLEVGGGAWDRALRPRREPLADLLGLPTKHPETAKYRWGKRAP